VAFPNSERVIYEINPIREVICQLRFPPILKIDTETPAAFQELIRTDFPLYAMQPAIKLPPDFPMEMFMPMGGSQTLHQFISKDGNWKTSLTRDFLSLHSRTYTRWEDFKTHLDGPLKALKMLYSPSFFVRIGLRYQDAIHRSTLGVSEKSWSDLLAPWIAGVLSSENVSDDLLASTSKLMIRLPDGRSCVQVNHGLAIDQPTSETCYFIDADFFDAQQVETLDALPRLDFLNRQAGLFFRWCIKDLLHVAMRPRGVPI